MNTEKRSKYTNDFVPIRTITNGMIMLENNEKVTGVKIFPRNIFILDPETRNMIINNLRNVYNLIDYEFWVIAADRPVDITAYLSRLQLLYNSQTNPVKRKLIVEDINKANTFTTNNVVDTEFYLLFKVTDMYKIQKKIRNLIQSFANAGLNFCETQMLCLTDQRDKIAIKGTKLFPENNAMLRDVDGLPLYIENFKMPKLGEAF